MVYKFLRNLGHVWIQAILKKNMFFMVFKNWFLKKLGLSVWSLVSRY
jgi:hypothetical protein